MVLSFPDVRKEHICLTGNKSHGINLLNPDQNIAEAEILAQLNIHGFILFIGETSYA